MNAPRGRLLLYAPNVHTGGGAVLLDFLLEAWPADLQLVAWLDSRARDRLNLPPGASVRWVRPNVGSRFVAEMTLAQFSAHGDRVLCFHGLPPLFPNEGEILVFQQNRNHFGMVQLDAFSWKTRQRIRFEQFVAYVFRRRCASYWVQTPSMAQSLKKWYGDESVEVHVLPFLMPVASANAPGAPQRDFIYVADGEGHKNHRRLIEAWVILAKQNVFPTLALTLSRRDSSLLAWIHSMIERYDLRVSNLGQLPHEALVAEYVHSNALIFPSVSESFGLPLLEARELGLRIVASELDFVRDVCEPIETFDPYAPVSIARAVRRFLGHRESVVEPVSASLFLSTLLSSNS